MKAVTNKEKLEEKNQMMSGILKNKNGQNQLAKLDTKH